MRRREFIAGIGGAAVAWPLRARAQQRRAVPVIGFVSGNSESASAHSVFAFRQGLEEFGYLEAKNIEILYRWAPMQYSKFPEIAAELVGRHVNVIATEGSATTAAVKAATSAIPVVFTIGNDPVELGLVPSLNRPGSNMTGVSWLARTVLAKRLELLHEILPTATSIGFLNNPIVPGNDARISLLARAARTLGVRLLILNATGPNDIERAFSTLREQQIEALVVGTDFLFLEQRKSTRDIERTLWGARNLCLSRKCQSGWPDELRSERVLIRCIWPALT